MLTTLRSRIVALYLGLAVVPMIAVAAGSYFQSLRSLTALVEGKLRSASEQIALSITDREREFAASLRVLANSEYAQRVLGARPDAAPSMALPAYLSNSLRRSFVSVEFRDPSGAARVLVARDPDRAVMDPCVAADLVEVRVPVNIAGVTGELAGLTPFADLLPESALGIRFGRTGETMIMDRATMSVMYSSRCRSGEPSHEASGALTLGDVEELPGAGSYIGFRIAGRDVTGAVERVPNQPFDVIAAVDMAEFTAPYARAQILFLSIVLLIVAAVGGAFLLLVGRSMGSLAQLTTAAERIGEGELMPWLPLPVDDEVGKLSYAFAVMMARLKDTMRQNAESRQMAAVGQLASQLSHEIRNPLSSIKLNLQSLERETRNGTVPPDLPALLRICLREINRLNDAVTSVLEFGRPRAVEKRLCHVEGILEESLSLLQPRLRRQNIKVERSRGAGDDVVFADSDELSGAFLNLLINAIDAMPAGGVLRLRSEQVNGEIRIHVADSGPGIRPDLRDRIFQPFFTTKPSGSGIGLPLAMQVIRSHEGRLYCETTSELAAGAEFIVALPLHAGAARPVPAGGWRRAKRREDGKGTVSAGVTAHSEGNP